MKNIFKLAVVALVAFSTTYATDVSVTVTPAVASNIITGPIHLTSLEVINNGSDSAMNVWLFDAPSTNTTYSLGAYTNWTTYVSNMVVQTIDYQGVTNLLTNYVTYTLPRAVGASSPSYKLIKSFNVATNGTSTWNPVGGVYLSFGAMLTNNVTNVVYNITYSTLQ